MASTSLSFLVPDLRLHLGDMVEPYKYTTISLVDALVIGAKELMHKQRNRYIVSSDGMVSRNTSVIFEFVEPPIIQYSDEILFILQAAIIIKCSTLSDTIWDMVAWKDYELSWSNSMASKLRKSGLNDDKERLEYLLRRRLLSAQRQSLGGFKLPQNIYEG